MGVLTVATGVSAFEWAAVCALMMRGKHGGRELAFTRCPGSQDTTARQAQGAQVLMALLARITVSSKARKTLTGFSSSLPCGIVMSMNCNLCVMQELNAVMVSKTKERRQ